MALPPVYCPSLLYGALASALFVQCVRPWSHPPDIFKVVKLGLDSLKHVQTFSLFHRAVDIRLKCLLVTDRKVGQVVRGMCRSVHGGGGGRQTPASDPDPARKNIRPDRK